MDAQNLIKKYKASAKIPGISVGLNNESKVEFFNYGEIKTRFRIVPNENTVFEIASVSKTFTSILLAILQKEGLLDKDDLVLQHIPKLSKISGFEKMTLYHLATHTSGLPNLPAKFVLTNLLATLKQKNTYGNLPTFSSSDLIEFFEKSKPKSVGVTWSYSNGGMGLLGHIFERITGTSYEGLVKEKICNKLGMKDTGIDMFDSHKGNMATGHSYFGKPTEHWIAPSLEGAIGLYSTVSDLVKFLKGNLGLIDTEILPEMRYCQESRFIPQMSYFMKKIMFPILGVKFDQMALGWMTLKTPNDILFYDGGTGAFSSFIGIDPSRKRGVVVLANKLSKSTHKLGMEILKAKL